MLRPSAGVCDFVEDPELDARQVRPLWIDAPDAALRVHAAAQGEDTFCVWRIPGRKRLTLRGPNLSLEASHLALRLRATVDAAVSDGAAMNLFIPLDSGVRSRLRMYQAQAAMLRGVRFEPQAREPTRAGLLHLRALQALDGEQHGASHREIAEALFGHDAVRQRWSADGELRAQVRHLLARAHEFLYSGYRELARANT